jgi:hypothetical protein
VGADGRPSKRAGGPGRTRTSLRESEEFLKDTNNHTNIDISLNRGEIFFGPMDLECARNGLFGSIAKLPAPVSGGCPQKDA